MVSHLAQDLSCIRSLGLVVPDRTAWFVVLSLFLSCIILLLLLLKRLRLARQQLRQHEARGRALFENAIDAILTSDADTGMLLDANSRAQALLGRSLHEIRSMHHTQLYPPEERELANERFARSAEAPAESLVQLHVVTAAGRRVPVEISSGGAAMVDGRRVLIGIFRDVSERIAREEELRRQQARLDSIFRAAPVGIGVVVNRVFTEVNDTLCRMVGYSREEMIGRCSRFLYPTQEDFEYVGAVKYGRMASQGTGTVETRWRCKDGTILEILLSSTPIEPSDLSRGVTFTALDITERKRAEQALRRSERRFQSLFDAMTEMVVLHEVVCDDAGHPVDYRILDCNPAFTRIMGIPRQQAVGSLASRLYAGSDMAFRESYFRVAAGGEPLRFEIHYPPANKYFDISVVSPERGCFATVTSDVTERKLAERERLELEKQVQHAQKLESLGVLAGGIAHDFNNLLTAILGNASMALAQLPEGSPGRLAIAEIEHASHRAADLCHQMLAYAGHGQIEARPLDLSSMVREMASMLEVSISKKATLCRDLAGDLPAIEADPAQVRQVILNLIINASEAMEGSAGSITLSTGCEEYSREELAEAFLGTDLAAGRYVHLEVRDTGCGMTRQTLDRIFDPFFSTKFAGRGLGLAAVLGIVRRHRGAIQVRSTPGRGTSFRVLFPASSAPVRFAPPAEASLPWRASGTILIVDDEKSIRNIAGGMAEHVGFSVLTAEDGLRAIELLELHREKITCVLLDLTMPRMDGEQTFRELHRICPGLPVILSSGYAEEEVARRFEGRRVAGFIQKPYRLETFIERVRQAVSTGPAGRAPGGASDRADSLSSGRPVENT